MAGTWIRGRTCGQCQKQEGRSPSKVMNRGIDASGLCENCRTYNAAPWLCPICQEVVAWNKRGTSLNGITQAVTRGHLDCLRESGLMNAIWPGR